MRERSSHRRRLALTFGASALAVFLAACAGVLGLDDVTVADDGGSDAAVRATGDARADAEPQPDAEPGRDSSMSPADGGEDASDGPVDSASDAIADAPDVGPLCGTFYAYNTDLLDSGCIEVIQDGGTIAPTTAADGTSALLLSVGAGGGTAGFAFTLPVVRNYVGQVIACNLYGNLVNATAPVPATVIGQITPLEETGALPGSVYMHDDAVGTSLTDTSILSSGLDDETFNFGLSVNEEAAGQYDAQATFKLGGGDFHETTTGPASSYVRYFFGVQSEGAISMAVTEIGCTD